MGANVRPQVLEANTAIERARELSARFALTAAEHDRTGAFPSSNFEALSEAGLLNLTIPRSSGGSGVGLETACRVVETIAHGEPSTALVYAMHLIYHAAATLGERWNPAMLERMRNDSLSGVALINVMRVEPELGTPARGGLPATTATPVAGGWTVSGHKIYSTGSPMLKYFLTWARTAGDHPKVGWFAIPRGTPGLRVVETWDHMGMRATGSHDLILEDACVPADHMLDLRPPAEWMDRDPAAGAWNGLMLSSLYSGIARSARDWLVGYLHERVPSNLGASLATLPRMQSAVGEMEALLFTNERLLFGLAHDVDTNPTSVSPVATSLAKYTSTNNAVKVVDIALSLVGNPGLARSNPLERHHRDVLCSRIHVPQDDMVVLMAGKAALGIK
jgi:alkylation response protein AidB-like acyl-CoA dehydrogenase